MDEVDESGYNGCKWIKMDENEWKWMIMDESG